ncbi:MAG: glutathione S-transferase family protein [Pseudomonadota bacterium]
MTMRLHWSPDSANLVVRIALEVLDLDFEGIRVNRGVGDHKRAEFLAMNPQGLLPVLEDGDLVLFETAAILWHVIERAGRFGPEGPGADDPAARAAALRWMFYLSNTVHADLRVAFYTNRYVSEGRVAELRDAVRARLQSHLDLLEAEVGQGGLLGGAITVPDIYLCVCMRWMQIYPPGAEMADGLSNWPKLRDLAGRIETLPGARRAFEAESITPEGALTASDLPTLSRAEVTGEI